MQEEIISPNLNIEETVIETTDVMTGDRNRQRYLYYQLVGSLKKAQSVDIIVSFLMESGVKLILKELDNALNRGAKIRILTGNYLGITQPSALYLIKQKLGDRVDLRFYNDKKRSFHPKAYIFHYSSYNE
jgi:HKD family nuclease